MSGRLFAFFIAFSVSLVCGLVAAQEQEECVVHLAALNTELGWVKENAVKRAANRTFPDVTEAVEKNGVENALAVRNNFYQEIGNAPATKLLNSSILQKLIRMRMNFDYCELIWSSPGRNPDDQMASVETVILELETGQKLRPIDSTKPDALTATPRMRSDGREGYIRDISFGPSISLLLAQNVPQSQRAANEPFFDDPVSSVQPQVPPAQKDYLRDPPLYVTISNRWFVIVGSAATEEKGIERMHKFKKKAPQYDFSLYQPYGNNENYAIMMASWVPKSIAEKALEDAWRDVTVHRDHDGHDAQNPHPQAAYLWNCKSLGDRC